MIHEIKCSAKLFDDIASGEKVAIAIKNNKSEIGDYIALNDNSSERSALFNVMYVDEKEGYSELLLIPCKVQKKKLGTGAQILFKKERN